MLEPVLSKLADKSIILASGSPRRHHLLNLIGLKFKAIPSNFEENLDKNLFALPSDYVKETAKQKAKEVASNLLEKGTRADLIIGADTVVVLGDQILEKPADERHAAQMLASLSSRSHYVCTGITLITDIEKESMNIVQFHEKTEVIMGELSHEVIEAYVKTGEPM
ncbi:uncharacterized protein TRIADDRAFT_57097 [Trichoplax adhaerens]|uniref:Uncharacterized protein n=1 Tax=Trichoplax adhaerens TaxID=10228 RepID=B3S0L9_TRIAD|nr:hypothetical protein TRIADDRAFT_57097 [Trichoplax adhaerens]EDV24034.1 hypothetical protein TRIADDRAFT_57097 [Trichoplax adhaerens]|eukprot:XP_002113560.1 hypothetical protein TRIADDRAFT_57097 [Trichoplax adhaerens]